MKKRTKKPSDKRFIEICESKRPFNTEAAALDAADFGMLENMTLELGVYQCNVCQLWHLTTIK